MNKKAMRELRCLLIKLIEAEYTYSAKPLSTRFIKKDALLKLDENLAKGPESAIAFVCGLCDVQVEGSQYEDSLLMPRAQDPLKDVKAMGRVQQKGSVWYGYVNDQVLGPFQTHVDATCAIMNFYNSISS